MKNIACCYQLCIQSTENRWIGGMRNMTEVRQMLYRIDNTLLSWVIVRTMEGQNIHHTFHSEINYDIMLKCLTGYGRHQQLRYTSLNENVHMEWTDFGALLIL
jgi:hypothetical protein